VRSDLLGFAIELLDQIVAGVGLVRTADRLDQDLMLRLHVREDARELA